MRPRVVILDAMTSMLRDSVREAFEKRFGPPQILDVSSGKIFRWVLQRANSMHLYVTLDSPELPDVAHIMISDPSSKAVDPISNRTLSTIEEAEQLIELIEEQWKNPGARTSRSAPEKAHRP